MLENYKDVVTTEELCDILRIGRSSAYGLLHRGEIKTRRLRNKFIIPKAEIVRYLQSCGM